ARRVESLAQLPERDARREARRAAVEAALQLAEAYSRGDACSSPESIVQAMDASRGQGGPSQCCENAAGAAAAVAHAAALALGVHSPAERAPKRPTVIAKEGGHPRPLREITVDLAALDAFTAALEAYEAVGYGNNQFVAATLNDYDR